MAHRVPQAGKVYKVRNLSSPEGVGLCLEEDSPENYNHFYFLGDGGGGIGRWWIACRSLVNVSSLKDLRAKPEFTAPESSKRPAADWVWEIREENGHHLIRHVDTDRYAAATRDGDPILIDQRSPESRDLWTLEAVDEFAKITGLDDTSHNSASLETPALDSMSKPPEQTERKFIGQAAIPWFLVRKDPAHGHDKAWIGEHSPYYVLRRYSRWALKDWNTVGAHGGSKYSVEITYGLSTEDKREVENTLNIGVSAEAGLTVEGASASIKAELSAGLRVTVSEARTTSYSRKTVFERSHPSVDYDWALALWHRLDQYELYRANGDYVMGWDVLCEKEKVERTYPPEPRGTHKADRAA
ncbi:hypothetical protein NE857_29680 [Nocardiopsis exhalans]|uniref:Insecticidal crystal toxin domain-containing protein n=1 Tax=Nocardiopsis exhalans TaxID=163604 RepID=A0ABY5D810_9ACTN|nr:hypothetical protein [Nocardiopsis exhalans]USY19373.1 hypothetical protein NE857_29680 [Nocardiopsis exhalans]